MSYSKDELARYRIARSKESLEEAKILRACLEVVLWKRKWPILGSHEAHFRGHSSAMGEEIAEMRFQKRTFAAQMITSKHALSQSNHWNTVANRLYYSCFYIASAYLVINNAEASTHNGIKIGFNKELIRHGKLDKRYGELYNKLFNLRQDADYRDYKDVSEEKIKPLIKDVEELINNVERLIEEGGS